jgi:hypothetical protein
VIERYVPAVKPSPTKVVGIPPKRKGPRAAATYRAARRNRLKNTKRVRMSRAERLAQMQGPAKLIERKE